MKPMVLKKLGNLHDNKNTLELIDIPAPQPDNRELLIEVSACGSCTFCESGRENLCSEFQATGRDQNGGYAEFMTALEEANRALYELKTGKIRWAKVPIVEKGSEMLWNGS